MEPAGGRTDFNPEQPRSEAFQNALPTEKLLPGILLALACALPAPAGMVGWLTSQTRNWDFVQQTGGIRIGQPVEQDGRLVLPVEYDVTGTGSGITRRPTLINSGLAVRRLKLDRANSRQLVIQVVTQVIEQDSDPSPRHYAVLEDLTSGSYDVYYEDAGDEAKFLGQIQVR